MASLTIYVDGTLVSHINDLSPAGAQMRIRSSTVEVYNMDVTTLVGTWTYSGGGTFLGLSTSEGAVSPDAGLAVGQTKTFSFMDVGTYYYYSVAQTASSGLTVTYKGNTIHTASASGSATLNTAGKYMEGDVSLSYTFDDGGGVTVEPLSVTANGTYTAPTGKAYSPVTVNVSGGGGGGSDAEDGIIMRTISGTYENSRVTTIGYGAFNSCTSLTAVSFPAVTTISKSAFASCYKLTTASVPSATTIGNHAFAYCQSLTSVSFPAVTTIGSSAFYACTGLTTISFPSATTIGGYAFQACASLTTVSFPSVTTINTYAFRFCASLTTASFPAASIFYSAAFSDCTRLISLYLLGSSVAKLSVSNAFTSTPIGGYSTVAGQFGSIYVPSSLYNTYKASTNWTYFSSRFVSV